MNGAPRPMPGPLSIFSGGSETCSPDSTPPTPAQSFTDDAPDALTDSQRFSALVVIGCVVSGAVLWLIQVLINL